MLTKVGDGRAPSLLRTHDGGVRSGEMKEAICLRIIISSSSKRIIWFVWIVKLYSFCSLALNLEHKMDVFAAK